MNEDIKIAKGSMLPDNKFVREEYYKDLQKSGIIEYGVDYANGKDFGCFFSRASGKNFLIEKYFFVKKFGNYAIGRYKNAAYIGLEYSWKPLFWRIYKRYKNEL